MFYLLYRLGYVLQTLQKNIQNKIILGNHLGRNGVKSLFCWTTMSMSQQRKKKKLSHETLAGMVKSLFRWTTVTMSQQKEKKKYFSGNLGWNGEEPLLVDDHVHVAAEDVLQLHGNVHVDAAVRRLVREEQVGECLLLLLLPGAAALPLARLPAAGRPTTAGGFLPSWCIQLDLHKVSA
jgi:hypothetical protein